MLAQWISAPRFRGDKLRGNDGRGGGNPTRQTPRSSKQRRSTRSRMMPMSEDDRHEDLKPQYGGNDRHETQAEVE
jgi:hypothetical protein